MKAPYEFKSYRQFIDAKLEAEKFGRGSKKALSELLGVQKSFISQVLTGKFDFTLEHVPNVAKFLGLDSEDSECLLLMVMKERAGSTELKNYFDKKLTQIREVREKIHAQIQAESSLNEADYSLFTAAWYHIAIHMCLRNPELREIQKISKYLGIKPEEVSRSLKILEQIGFAERTRGQWNSKVVRYNANKESPGLKALHSTWRNMAIHSLDSPDPKDLHYSLVVSIDSKAVEKMREMILTLIKSFEPVIQSAEDQEVVSFTLDLFRLGK